MAVSTNLTAEPGFNASLSISAATATSYSTSNQTSIGNVLNVSSSFDCDEIDVTPITSTGHKVYIAGARSATISFDMAFDYQNTQHNLIAQQWSSGATNYYAVEMPNQLGTSFASHWVCRGFVTNMGPGIDPSDKHNASVSVRLIEAPTIP